MSCDVRSFDGIGLRVGDCEPLALTCIGELHGLRDLGLSIPPGLAGYERRPRVSHRALLTGGARDSGYARVRWCNSLECCAFSVRMRGTSFRAFRYRASDLRAAWGFLSSACSMASLSLHWCVWVFSFRSFDHSRLTRSCFCFASLASLDIASLDEARYHPVALSSSMLG